MYNSKTYEGVISDNKQNDQQFYVAWEYYVLVLPRAFSILRRKHLALHISAASPVDAREIARL